MDDIEFITYIPLFNDIFSRLYLYLFQNIGYLVSFVRIHILEELDFVQNRLVCSSLLLSRVFDNVSKGLSVKGKENTLPLARNCGGPWCVIQ